MSFDIPLHVPDNSPEARAIESVVNRDKVSPEEAVLSILRGALPVEMNPAREGRGLFSSPEDAAALDAAVSLAYEERRRPPKRAATH